MTDVQKKMLVVAVAMLVLAVIAFGLRTFWGTTTVQQKPVVQGTAQGSTTPESELTIPLAPVTPQQTVVQKNRNMTAFAMQFTERYGSYSSEGNFQNLKDLMPSMTDAMRAKSQATVSAGVAPGAVFYGVTTQALAVKVENAASATATVVVSTRRTETKGTDAPMNFNQDARLQLIQSGDEWLVDSLTWLSR